MQRYFKITPFLILFGGFALRLYHLGTNSLWYDETVSLYLAQSDLSELIRHTAGDIHPPLYYILLHGWGRLAGWSEFSSAFLSLWFGMLLIAPVYRVTREWFGTSPLPTSTALLAALLVAISPYNIWYSQEVRMYTLGATLGLLSVHFLRRMISQDKIISRDLVAYALVTVAGFYTLYYFIFLMVLQWLWVAYRLWQVLQSMRSSALHLAPHALRSTYAPLLTFLVSQLAVVLLFLPWLPIAFRQATDPPVPPWREFLALPRVILETFGALAFGQSVDPNLFGILALLLLIPIAFVIWREWHLCHAPPATRCIQRSYPPSAIRHPRSTADDSPFAIRQSPSALFLLGYFLVPLAAIYLLSLWKPLYHVRYMFTYSPGFYILAAYVLVSVTNEFMRGRQDTSTRRMVPIALGVIASVTFLGITVFSLNNFWNSDQYQEDDLRGAVNYIAERWRPGDVILVNAGYAYPAVLYYFPQPIAERLRLVNYPPAQPTPGNSEPGGPILLQTGSIDGAANLGWGDPRSDFYATTADETRAALDRVFDNQPRVWMLRIYDTVVDANGVIRDYFNQHATLLADQPFSGESQTRVQGYLTQPVRDLPPTATRVDRNLGDRIALVGYTANSRDVARGKFLDVVLYWKILQSVNYNYQVTLQLLDAQGNNVAQTDEMPLSELLPMTRWQSDTLYREPLRLPIPSTLAPGTYRAIVKLYEPRSLDILGDTIALGTIQVP